MKRNWRLPLAAALVFAVLMAGCSLGTGLADPDLTSANLAEMASLTVDYDEKAMEVEAALLEIEEAEADADSEGTTARTVGTSDPDYVLPDGTEVYVTRELLDKETEDPEDDEVLTTRRFYLDDELIYREVMNRPVRPEADWSAWDGADVLVQYGESFHYAGESTDAFRSGTVEVTWIKDGDEVMLSQVVKETVHLVTMTTVVTTITIEGDVATKEQVRIRVTDGGDIVVHAFVYEQFEEDGILKTKIIREDGAYAIHWQEDGTWYTHCFDPNGILHRIRLETGTLVERSITVYFYDETGTEVIDTRTMDVSFTAGDDGSVVVTKTLDDGRVITLSIREGGRGYVICRNGFHYVVAVDLTTGVVTITDMRGNLIGTVTINDDGTWTVVTAGGDVEEVTL